MTEEKTMIAFQGEAGAYSEAAAIAFFGEQVTTLPCPSFNDIFTSVINRTATYGLIPIENSLAGSIHRNYDLMLRYDLHIFGEYHLRVSHCLMALPGVKLSEVRTVHSHPQALAQCDQHINELGFQSIVEADTAGSARMLREKDMRQAAAIASKRAAEVYHLHVLKKNMEDNPANYTRFLALSNTLPDQEENKDIRYKTSLVFSLKNEPGILYRALGAFAARGIDLTKIESRPIAGKPWEYMFYIDFTGHQNNPEIKPAIIELKAMAQYFKILGCYPRHILEY